VSFFYERVFDIIFINFSLKNASKKIVDIFRVLIIVIKFIESNPLVLRIKTKK
jgi:hypothetical protein